MVFGPEFAAGAQRPAFIQMHSLKPFDKGAIGRVDGLDESPIGIKERPGIDGERRVSRFWRRGPQIIGDAVPHGEIRRPCHGRNGKNARTWCGVNRLRILGPIQLLAFAAALAGHDRRRSLVHTGRGSAGRAVALRSRCRQFGRFEGVGQGRVCRGIDY